MLLLGSGVDSVRNLMPLLASRGLPFGAKGKLYSACLRTVMLSGSET